MPNKLTLDEFFKLYKNSPKEIREALSKDETGENIYNICKRHAVLPHLGKIVDSVTYVLLGLLLPDQLQKTIEKELEIKEETAKKIAQEIYRFIFYPVKTELEKLYKIEIATLEKSSLIKNIKEEPGKPDNYRESVEEK